MKEPSLLGNAYNTTDIWDPFEDFGSVHSSMRTSASQNNTSSFHDAITKELQDNAAPSTSHMPSSTSNCRPSAIPIISSSTALSLSVNNPFLRIPSSNSISSLRVTSQCLGSGAEAEALLLPKNSMPSGYSSPSNSFAANLNTNFWAATSSFSGYRGNSASTHGTGGSQVGISGSVQMVTSSLSPPAKSSSKSSSVASELPDSFLSFPQDSAPEHSAFFQFKDDQTKDQIVPCEQPSVQVTNSQALSTKDNITTVQSEAIIPSKPVEICSTIATDSLNACYDWKGSSSNRPNQLLADNDLFEGMELDLSPGILRQESWDDIIMPVGSSSCSNLSTNISECMPDMGMGSLAAADKGLFYGSSFEQLLDAVVEESANPLSGNSSVPVGVSSTGSLDFSQVSTVNRVDSHEGNMKLAPLAEFNLEKIFQQSSNEALVQSRVGSWTNGAGIRNAESVVTNKAKKPEETSKVKKRARPGESTRPRPKDRQQIQDRVKELREIVPNGAKVMFQIHSQHCVCTVTRDFSFPQTHFNYILSVWFRLMQQCSIDSLLDRTIKHMLFLQSVTKYVDKLKQTDEPKVQCNALQSANSLVICQLRKLADLFCFYQMIGDESGVVLKDNSGGGAGGGGATWAYEVAGQTMVCPILVEDLNPPGQMLVEVKTRTLSYNTYSYYYNNIYLKYNSLSTLLTDALRRARVLS